MASSCYYIGTILLVKGDYEEDERSGHGVMTYLDGSQDVGVWQGEWINRLYSHIPEATLECSVRDGENSGSRAEYGMKGPIEMASEELIVLSASGDTVQVQVLLERGEICVDVADNVGNTALIAAAVS